jgi:hypothetical protein
MTKDFDQQTSNLTSSIGLTAFPACDSVSIQTSQTISAGLNVGGFSEKLRIAEEFTEANRNCANEIYSKSGI